MSFEVPRSPTLTEVEEHKVMQPTQFQQEVLEHYDIENLDELLEISSMVNLNLSDKGLENKEEYKQVVNTKDRVKRVKAIRDALYPAENIKIENDTNKKDFIKVVQGYIGKDKSGNILTETG